MIREILFVLVQVFANTIQAITGFAGAPIAMPPSIILVGVSDAKASLTLIFWFAALIVTLQNLKKVNWKKLGIMIGFMAFGVVAGLWLFHKLPIKVLMILYGLIVLGIGAKKLFFPSNRKLPKWASYGVLILSGLMQGMFTSGGPFLVLYASDAMPEKEEFRATVCTVWTIINVYLVTQMARGGMYHPYCLKLAGISILPVFAGIYAGNKINKKIKQETFLKLVYGLLIVSGGLLLYQAL